MSIECKLHQYEDRTTLLALRIGNNSKIKEKDAKYFVEKYKDHKYIMAEIRQDELHIMSKYPKIELTCIDKETNRPLIPKFMTVAYPIIKQV